MTASVIPLIDDGLGNSTYLVELGDGRALVVDATRDLRAVHAEAERRGLGIAFAADTHLHADFVTGALELAAHDGARILASAGGARAYGHEGLGDGDDVDLGGLTLRALATPGHTHEHLAFELLDGSTRLGVFTGGSLLVGAAARTDLGRPDEVEALARRQYRSLQRLAELPDEVAVWPTHGAGSFCSAPPGAERTSTIGTERATNPFLRTESEDRFVDLLLGSLGSFPPYFLRLAELNRRGPALIDPAARLRALDLAEVQRLRMSGAELIDVRPAFEFAFGHIPGSISIPLRGAFATWLGWLVEHGRPLIFVRGADQDPDEIRWQALKIGYDTLAGELTGGVAQWRAADQPLTTIAQVDAAAIGDTAVLDVRQTGEFAGGHIPGARHLELGELTGRTGSVPAGPTVVMCGHGERAMTAASLLARAGRTDIAVLDGGPDDWAAVTGRNLKVGM